MRILLEMVTKRPDVEQLLVIKEEDTIGQQECSSSLNQEGQEPHLVKKETQDEDGDKVKEEATEFSITPVDVKSECHETSICLTQQIKTEADDDDCGGPEPASCLDTPLLPDHQRSLCSESESDTDDSEDWRETNNTQSGSNFMKSPKVHVSEMKDGADHKSLICSGCGKKCSSKYGLTQHIKSGCGSLTCSICGKSFQRKSNLKKHTRVHTGEKPFSCSQCGNCFATQMSLKEHVKIHTGEKPFSCCQCGKCFARKTILQDHMRVHTGEKPFSCPQCGERFTWKLGLKQHTRIHTGENPFICSQCGKCFTRKETLEAHTRIHTGDKPFNCSHCGKCFTQRGNLMSHMRVHTGKNQ